MRLTGRVLLRTMMRGAWETTVRPTLRYSWRTTRDFLRQLRRVKWPLIISLLVIGLRQYGILAPQSISTLVAYKIALAFIAFVAAHIAYTQIFPYIDMRELLFRSLDVCEFEGQMTEHAQFVAGIAFVGACVMRGLIYTAFVLGVLMGL